MKFESVISETKAKGEQVWLAFDHNGDQLQLDPKWLDGGIRGPLADYVFLIRAVSICDGCPFYSRVLWWHTSCFAGCELPQCVWCPLTAWGGPHPPTTPAATSTVSFWKWEGEVVYQDTRHHRSLQHFIFFNTSSGWFYSCTWPIRGFHIATVPSRVNVSYLCYFY